MTGKGDPHERRSLTDIEGDLLKAEQAFVDAETRLKEAERDRNVALSTIDKHQEEFDEAIAVLRGRSTPGSRWRREIGTAGDASDVHADQELSGEGASSTSKKSAAAEFDRLRAHVQSAEDEPVFRIRMK